MNHNLIITVSGATGSGKSSVTTLIAEILKEKGFNVEVFDGDAQYLDPTKNDIRLQSLANHGMNVIVRTQQRPRGTLVESLPTGQIFENEDFIS